MREGWITVAGLFLILLGFVAYLDEPDSVPDEVDELESTASGRFPSAASQYHAYARAIEQGKLPPTANAASGGGPGGDDAPRDPAEFAGPLVAPSFDIVRIETDGTAVISGRAAPGSNITILIDSRPMAMARANARGEWTVLIDSPIDAGPHALLVKASDPEGREEIASTQQVSIGLSKQADDEPIIVFIQKGASAPEPESEAPAATHQGGARR